MRPQLHRHAELVSCRGNRYPLPIVRANNSRCRHYNTFHGLAGMKGGRYEHCLAQGPLRIWQVDAHLRRARVGIEHVADVERLPGKMLLIAIHESEVWTICVGVIDYIAVRATLLRPAVENG